MPALCMRPAFHPGDINRYGFIRNAHRLEKISGGPFATLYFEGPFAREITLAKGAAVACRMNGRRRVTIGCSGDGAAGRGTVREFMFMAPGIVRPPKLHTGWSTGFAQWRLLIFLTRIAIQAPLPGRPAVPLFPSIEKSPIRSRENGIKDFGRMFHASDSE